MLPKWGDRNPYSLTYLDKWFLIHPMATLGNYMVTGTGVDNREIGVNRNRSGETTHEVDLHESPQWPFPHGRGVVEGPRDQGEGCWGKAVPQSFPELLVGISETQSFKGSISGDFTLKFNSC